MDRAGLAGVVGPDGGGPAASVGFTRPKVQSRLFDEFCVEVPVVEWEGQPFARVSIQTYNTPTDVDRLVDALATLL